ncbi:type IV secretion system protein [Fusobacterium sp. FSA-380-WT-2B]|uniref:type IV secretion system protein n=1 Tax=Fusobacterium sp. FSA-380-WT-2B TaxID=2605786 RepID=UPI0018A6B361|nr:type IV secretion system protein [Fusobacterium sp. FSA-380-WT-2B]
MFNKKKEEKEKKEKKFFDYEQAKKEFLNSNLNPNRARVTWIKLCFFSMGITFVSLIGMIYFASRSKVIPYFFEVDRNGIVQNLVIGNGEKAYQPNEVLIESSIKNFISNFRWISKDEVVQNLFVERAFNYTTPHGIEKLKSIYAQEELTTLIKNGVTRDIKISSVTKADNNLYNARWEENIYSEGGTLVNSVNKFGNFKVEIIPPKSTKELERNPLGITITDFNISTLNE